MNALFLTQSYSLVMFYDLLKALEREGRFEKVGFYVSDSFQYEKFLKSHPTFERDTTVVKEWEIVKKAKALKIDHELLKKWEQKLGVPSLWPALIADRRLTMGKYATLHQDYRRRFDHETLLKILQETLAEVGGLFDKVQPDMVFSFICVTTGEYIGYLMAKERNIRFLNLRPTRIKNYMTWADSIFEPSTEIMNEYERADGQGNDAKWIQEANAYVEKAQTEHALYEGVIKPSRRPQKALLSYSNSLSRIGSVVRRQFRYWFSEHRQDHHAPGFVTKALYTKIINPLTAAHVNWSLSKHYVGANHLPKIRYAFFPLHTEPEVSLLVYSPANVNQIEAVRRLGGSLPVGMKLIVKEHPAAIGKRPVGFYRKLMNIPNVLLADPALEARELIRHSDLVAVIVGSVALEALLLKKPVITFGKSPFDFLPKNMIRRMRGPDVLDHDIQDLLSHYAYDNKAMVRYVASVMKLSVPIDFYSTLLNKKGVFQFSDNGANESERYSEGINRLAEHTLARIQDLSSTSLANQPHAIR